MTEKEESYIVTLSIVKVRKRPYGGVKGSVLSRKVLLRTNTLEEAKDKRDRIEDIVMGVELL